MGMAVASTRAGRPCWGSGATTQRHVTTHGVVASTKHCRSPGPAPRGCAPCATPSRSRVAMRAGGIDLDALLPPEIDADVRAQQRDLGATFDEAGVATTFSNGDKVIEALQAGVALCDRSHWGCLHITGEDRLAFLNNQSTNDFLALQPGQGVDTVFVNATARCLDLATALVGAQHVLLLVSPGMAGPLAARFDKYIFPADKVAVRDVSDRCSMFSLMGPKAAEVLSAASDGALDAALRAPRGSHALARFVGGAAPVMLISGSGLSAPGYTLVVDESMAAAVYDALTGLGCVPMGQDDWERARVTSGRPAAGAELTEAYNPLEAGLWGAVSIAKGCYIGQETLAKVARQGAVKQQLWGLQLAGLPAPGSAIAADGQALGVLTSSVDLGPDGYFGVGYIKSRSKGAAVAAEGLTVEVAGVAGRVVAVPFLARGFPAGSASAQASKEQQPPPGGAGAAAGGTAAGGAQAAGPDKAAQRAAEEAAKAERLAAMQARMAAWQQQQAGAGQQGAAWQQQQAATGQQQAGS